MTARFDLDAFARAAEAQDHEAWLAWYAPHAQWWEYRHADAGTAGDRARRRRRTAGGPCPDAARTGG